MEFTKANKEGTTVQTEKNWKRATRRLATRVNAQGRLVQRRNLATEGRGTQSSWDKLNKRLEPLAQLHSTTGEVYWHASIREEWKELHILGDEGEDEEQETPPDDPEDTAEDNREEEDTNNYTEEEEETPEHRRDENNEYFFGCWILFFTDLIHNLDARRSKNTCQGDPRPEAFAQTTQATTRYIGCCTSIPSPSVVV